jgi:hypothetical protein
MPCSSVYFLIDEIGGIWNLTVTNTGLIQMIFTTTTTTSPVLFLIVQDVIIAMNWQISVISSGNLRITGIAPAPAPRFLGLRSPNGSLYRLTIANGSFLTTLQPVSNQPVPAVGTIYPPAVTFLPKFTQPGGPGTATFPQQDPGEMLGLFVAGCGHWFNNWNVLSATVNCDQVAVMCCPLCGYCQRIIDPYSDIYSFQNEILIA